MLFLRNRKKWEKAAILHDIHSKVKSKSFIFSIQNVVVIIWTVIIFRIKWILNVISRDWFTTVRFKSDQ